MYVGMYVCTFDCVHACVFMCYKLQSVEMVHFTKVWCCLSVNLFDRPSIPVAATPATGPHAGQVVATGNTAILQFVVSSDKAAEPA